MTAPIPQAPLDLYKLEPVSQYRIQKSVQSKKESKGVKPNNVDRNASWDEINADTFSSSSVILLK